MQSLVTLLLASQIALTDPPAIITDVDGQPLAANADATPTGARYQETDVAKAGADQADIPMIALPLARGRAEGLR